MTEALVGYGLKLPTAEESRSSFDSITQLAVDFINTTIVPAIVSVQTKSKQVELKLSEQYYVGSCYAGLRSVYDKKEISDKVNEILRSEPYGYHIHEQIECYGNEVMNGYGKYVISWEEVGND